MSYRNVIGFDLGHGETAITALVYGSAATLPSPLEIIEGHATVLTAYGTKPDGTVVLGEHAAVTRNLVSGSAYFKDRPDRLAQTGRDDVTRFVKAVADSIRASGQADLGPDTLVVFGHPSGWAPEHVACYAELLAGCVGTAGVKLIPESRAAFISALRSGQIAESDLAKRVLVIDCGSSTTDFTLIEDAESAPVDLGDFDGVPLGAGLIDVALMEQAIDACSDAAAVRALLESSAGALLANQVKIYCRREKENFYSSEETFRDDGAMTLVTSPVRVGDTLFFGEFDAAAFDRATGTPMAALRGDSWLGRLEKDMRRCLMSLSGTPEIVILTGGAARMSCVKETAVRVFAGAPQISRASEPGLAIARGLALAGHTSDQVQSFRDEIHELIAGDAVERVVGEHLAGLASAISAPLCRQLREDLIPPRMFAWRDGQVPTLRHVTALVSADAQQWQRSEEGKQVIAEALGPWYDELAQSLRDLTDPICTRYGLAPGSLGIQVSVGTGNINAGDPGQILLEAPKAIASAVMLAASMVVGTVLLGTGTAMLVATGPFAPIILGMALWAAADYGLDAIKEQMLDADVPTLARKSITKGRILKSVNGKAEEIDENVLASVVKALTAPETAEDELARKQVVHQIATSIDESLGRHADVAEALIR